MKKGFTLIEMLVVISIIGILATLIFARLGSTEKAGRDTKRKSDLNQYRIALQNFAAAHNGVYPVGNNCAHTILATALGDYLSVFPTDPLNPACDWTKRLYSYKSGTSDGMKYVLYVHGALESDLTKTWYVCWNGKTGLVDNNPGAVYSGSGSACQVE